MERLDEVLAEVYPGSESVLQLGFSRVKLQTGFDIKQEILDALGDEGGRIYASPFSHDASAGGRPDNPIPEPGTLSLLGAGLLGLVPFMRRRSKSKT